MATDVTNCVEDVEMSECEEDKVVTMMDVLQEQEDFEEDANAVLGASDDKNCTYSKGYIKRQALYACMTCCSEAKCDPTKRAGLCLACSLICHENHELVELYTKRNFRCDCGNSKFNSYRCQLTPNKVMHNEENSYNQNFSGLYCVCQRPYPDPNNKVEDDMIQCIICEDWLHASHLETVVPANDQYTEMICKGCMNKNDFLYSYSNLVVNVDTTEVDIININETEKKSIYNGDTKTGNNIKSQENQDVPEEIPVTSINICKIEIDQNIKSTNKSSEMINNVDSQDNQHSILSEKETLNKSPEILTDSPMSSDIIENVVNEMPQKMQNPNIEINKIEDIADTKKDENVSANTSEQNKSDDQLKETLNDNNVSASKEIVDNKAKSQEEDTNQDSNVTNKETQDDNITTEATVKNKNKDEESMEEDRLLGDSENEDKNCKSNLNDEKREDSKTSYSIENASSDKQIDEIESGNKTLSSPKSDENDSSNSKQEIENKTIILPNDKEESTKLINEESQEPNPSLGKKSNLGDEVQVESNDLPLIDKPNNKETESNIENHIENIKATTSEKEVQEESGNTEQSTSNVCKDSEPNTLDKVTEKRKLSTEGSLKNIVVKKTKLEEGSGTKSCICPRNVKKVHRGATFWPSNFRQKLCTCQECLTLYKDLSVLFLIDPEDTVSTYTNLGIEKTNGKPSQYEKGLQALSSLDRIQQINALTEYNKMRDKLLDFLKSFKDRKEIVKEEDIKAFFAGMKPTRAPDGVYFCR